MEAKQHHVAVHKLDHKIPSPRLFDVVSGPDSIGKSSSVVSNLHGSRIGPDFLD